MDGLNPDDSRPPYQQVAEAVRQLIDAGELRPGDKLPKHEELVATYGVSVGTVKRALGQLQDEGLIVSRRGEGAFVRSAPARRSVSEEIPATDMRREIDALARRLAIVEEKLAQEG